MVLTYILHSRFVFSVMLCLYNTLAKEKQPFEPLKDGSVKMYTCGPTVYDYVHIGNLRSYVMADTLRRVLEADGLVVTHVKNITDVGHLTADDLGQGDSGEDKLVKKAVKEGKTPEEIARFYTDYYHATEARLNILPASVEPRATEYVAEMKRFIEGLVAKEYAYVTPGGNVFFRVKKFSDYGKLSGNTLEQLKVGARLEEHPEKEDPWDFALWLAAPEGHLMRWDSPCGIAQSGYPGWHIECSAMNLATLGKTIDIHTGGEDNIFPHHEAEIAQSECGNDAPFVRYWVHARHLLVDGQKMSKSKGNFYRLEDIEKRGYTAMDLRMLYLSAHYRSQMNFTWEALEQAKANRFTVMNTYERLKMVTQPLTGEVSQELGIFKNELQNDLNTPLALSTLLRYTSNINKALDKKEYHRLSSTDLKDLSVMLFDYFGLVEEIIEIPEAVTNLLEERKQAREQKDFAQSDALRDEIASFGYIVEDGPSGQTIRKK